MVIITREYLLVCSHITMQRHNSSASKPISTIFDPAVPKTAGFKDFSEAVIHVKGRDIMDVDIHKTTIQLRGCLICFSMDIRCILSDHITVKVDGNDPLHIATIGHLITFGIKTIASAAIGNKNLRAP